MDNWLVLGPHTAIYVYRLRAALGCPLLPILHGPVLPCACHRMRDVRTRDLGRILDFSSFDLTKNGLELDLREDGVSYWQSPAFSVMPDGRCRFTQVPEIIVTMDKHRPCTPRLRSFVWSRPLPDGAFLALPGNVALPRPELVLHMLASHGGTPLHVLAGLMSLACSGIGLLPNGIRVSESKYGFVRRPSLSSRATFAQWCDLQGETRGSASLRRALCHAVDTAESPQEIATQLMFGLPLRYGGLGHRSVLVNHQVNLTELGRSLCGKSACRIDVYLEDERFGLENQGVFDHYLTSGQAIDDDNRKKALAQLGITLEFIKHGDLANEDLVLDIDRRAWSACDKRPPTPTSRQRKLRARVWSDLCSPSFLR